MRIRVLAPLTNGCGDRFELERQDPLTLDPETDGPLIEQVIRGMLPAPIVVVEDRIACAGTIDVQAVSEIVDGDPTS